MMAFEIKFNLRTISKSHAQRETVTKAPVQFLKDQHKSVPGRRLQGVAERRYQQPAHFEFF